MGCALVDTDAAIEERTGRSIADIFAGDGESGFRLIEEQVIREALESHDGILSLGGGAVTTAGVRAALAARRWSTLKSVPPRAFAGPVATTFVHCWPDPTEAKYRELVTDQFPIPPVANPDQHQPVKSGAFVRYIVGRLDNLEPPPWRRRPPRRATGGCRRAIPAGVRTGARHRRVRLDRSRHTGAMPESANESRQDGTIRSRTSHHHRRRRSALPGDRRDRPARRVGRPAGRQAQSRDTSSTGSRSDR